MNTNEPLGWAKLNHSKGIHDNDAAMTMMALDNSCLLSLWQQKIKAKVHGDTLCSDFAASDQMTTRQEQEEEAMQMNAIGLRAWKNVAQLASGGARQLRHVRRWSATVPSNNFASRSPSSGGDAMNRIANWKKVGESNLLHDWAAVTRVANMPTICRRSAAAPPAECNRSKEEEEEEGSQLRRRRAISQFLSRTHTHSNY